jgi:hypothetical protein
MGGGKKPDPDRADKAKPAPPPTQPAPQPLAPQPLGNETRAEQAHSARAVRQFDRMELDSLVIEEKMSPSSSAPCPGLHACHAEPSKTSLEIVPPIDLEGHKSPQHGDAVSSIAKGGEGVRRTGSNDWVPVNSPVLELYLIVRDASHLQKKTKISDPLAQAIADTRGEIHYWIPDPKVR